MVLKSFNKRTLEYETIETLRLDEFIVDMADVASIKFLQQEGNDGGPCLVLARRNNRPLLFVRGEAALESWAKLRHMIPSFHAENFAIPIKSESDSKKS